MKQAGRIGLVFMVTAAVCLLSECAPSGKSLLTFFFDGVPGQDTLGAVGKDSELLPADSTGRDMALESSERFIHYPYQERECAACHDQNSMGSMIEPQPGLCYMCHEDFGDRYQYLHGPVAGGYCTSCHDPHSSDKDKLLRYSGEDLCFYCHQAESVFKNEMHEGLDGMTCTDCHNPHGGEDHFVFQ